jgi:DNA-binding CsgD family transcriptional regulator
MNLNPFKIIWKLSLLLSLITNGLVGQNSDIAKIQGFIKIDSSWSATIYLSYIPTFSDIHSMSNEMIIADSKIDNFGYFTFDLDFLPKEQKIYRLHISKKADSKTSLIIGGLNENYFTFIANSDSKIKLKAISSNPPFKNLIFKTENENFGFQKITSLVFKKDSIASASGSSKRNFIENRLNEELLNIADSSTNALVSLYAIYKSSFESNYISKEKFYTSYLNKWSKIDNSYFNDFRKKLPVEDSKNDVVRNIILSIILLIIGYAFGKLSFTSNKRIKKLSVQERKIFDLLKNGATNKDISDEFNIGISTVKSHVSSILNKLKIKSRKEIMD